MTLADLLAKIPIIRDAFTDVSPRFRQIYYSSFVEKIENSLNRDRESEFLMKGGQQLNIGYLQREHPSQFFSEVEQKLTTEGRQKLTEIIRSEFDKKGKPSLVRFMTASERIDYFYLMKDRSRDKYFFSHAPSNAVKQANTRISTLGYLTTAVAGLAVLAAIAIQSGVASHILSNYFAPTNEKPTIASPTQIVLAPLPTSTLEAYQSPTLLPIYTSKPTNTPNATLPPEPESAMAQDWYSLLRENGIDTTSSDSYFGFVGLAPKLLNDGFDQDFRTQTYQFLQYHNQVTKTEWG
ncbi:MAG: hypothetical protein HGA85_06625, partial [Nanoarchaeota archaeon]|nr:hypothetical protein [Nanoarchaeota archaeon]